jgi:histidinol-phosphate phosphatase family protein
MRARAIFCDRDGTIIRDVGYLNDPAQVELLPGAAAALGELKRQGFLVVLISNQSGIARGLITVEQAKQVHQRCSNLFSERGVEIDGALYCPHSPEDGCSCRKPSPGMLLEAAERFGIELGDSWMIGDKESDLEAGCRAGCRVIHLRARDAVVEWSEVLRRICEAKGG